MQFQAQVLDWLRPAQWMGFLHKQSRAKVKWQINDPKLTLKEVNKRLSEASNSHKLYRIVSENNHKDEESSLVSDQEIKLYLFTSWLGWLDVITLKNDQHSEGNTQHHSEKIIVVESISTSWVPCYIPLAPIFGALCCWVLFFDHGANLDHIRLLENDVEKNGFVDSTSSNKIIKERIVEEGKILGLLEYLFVLAMFLLTLMATLLNIFFNHNLPLNIVVTIVTAVLTINTIVTVFTALLLYRQRSNAKQTLIVND